jgi:hypothetical protein
VEVQNPLENTGFLVSQELQKFLPGGFSAAHREQGSVSLPFFSLSI